MANEVPMRTLILTAAALSAAIAAPATAQNAPKNARSAAHAAAAEPVDVVFICQHGYAKSLVAARHFERLALGRGLAVRVVARGLTPAPGVPDPLAANLRRDGFEVAGFRPAPVSVADLAGAEHIVGLGVTPPRGKHATVERWDDLPALDAGYGVARDAIAARFEPLLARVAAAQRPGS
jgi:arsenate reductase (thioredoxin)